MSRNGPPVLTQKLAMLYPTGVTFAICSRCNTRSDRHPPCGVLPMLHEQFRTWLTGVDPFGFFFLSCYKRSRTTMCLVSQRSAGADLLPFFLADAVCVPQRFSYPTPALAVCVRYILPNRHGMQGLPVQRSTILVRFPTGVGASMPPVRHQFSSQGPPVSVLCCDVFLPNRRWSASITGATFNYSKQAKLVLGRGLSPVRRKVLAMANRC